MVLVSSTNGVLFVWLLRIVGPSIGEISGGPLLLQAPLGSIGTGRGCGK